MAEKKRYARRRNTPMPAKIETPAERGQVFQSWLDSNDIFQEDFARAAKIGPNTISMYASGELDLARMRQATAERFITTMNLTDLEAWKLFNIPEENRKNFRTFRPPPYGHGEDPRKLSDMQLPSPLQGELSVPAGHIIQFDPTKTLEGIVITQLDDGRLFALPAQVAAGRGRILGQLVNVSLQQKN